jgi:hypothetical protein
LTEGVAAIAKEVMQSFLVDTFILEIHVPSTSTQERTTEGMRRLDIHDEECNHRLTETPALERCQTQFLQTSDYQLVSIHSKAEIE